MVRNKFKMVFNIGDCTIEEMEEILLYYRKRAREDCDSDLLNLVVRLFTFSYKSSKLDSHYPQYNYCLLGVADITSKLSRGSNKYDHETVMALANYFIQLHDYLFNLYFSDKYRNPSAVLSISIIDKLVSFCDFNNELYVKNLSDFSKLIFEQELSKFEVRNDIVDKSFKEQVEKIAYEPYCYGAFDLFGIDVPRNDSVLKFYREKLISDEKKYIKEKKGKMI